MMLKFKFFILFLVVCSSLLVFQNCGISSNFESSGSTSSEAGIDLSGLPQGSSSSSIVNKLELLVIKENKAVAEINLSDAYFIKINLDQTYNKPKLCMTTEDREIDCANQIQNFTDFNNLSGRYYTGERSALSFIQNDSASIMRTLFPVNKKMLTFLFYFLSENHQQPVLIGRLKINNDNDQGNSSTARVCSSTVSSDWSTFNRPGLNIRGVLPGGGEPATVSYKFSLDTGGVFSRGVKITVLPSSLGQYNGRIIFISECPNDFMQPPEGNTAEQCKGSEGPFGGIDLVLSGFERIFPKLCVIKPGKTYYLNMKTRKEYWGIYQESSYQIDTSVL